MLELINVVFVALERVFKKLQQVVCTESDVLHFGAQNRQTGSFSSDASHVSCVFSEEGLFR